jgi:hypothetical protein
MARPRTTPAAARELRKVSQIKELGADNLKKATPKVKQLQVKDLEELARRFQGVDVQNSKLDKLELDDFKSLEDVFQGYKHKALEQASRAKPARAPVKSTNGGGGTGGAGGCGVNVCCCCTPCCCCAAAAVDPFAPEEAVAVGA